MYRFSPVLTLSFEWANTQVLATAWALFSSSQSHVWTSINNHSKSSVIEPDSGEEPWQRAFSFPLQHKFRPRWIDGACCERRGIPSLRQMEFHPNTGREREKIGRWGQGECRDEAYWNEKSWELERGNGTDDSSVEKCSAFILEICVFRCSVKEAWRMDEYSILDTQFYSLLNENIAFAKI